MTDKDRTLIYIPKEGNYIEILGYKIDGFDSFESFCEYLKKFAEMGAEIERQQAEIERLNKEVETEIDKLNAEKNDVMYYKDHIKSEAIKEFESLIVNNLIEQAYSRDYLLCLIKEWAKEMTEAQK